MQPAIVSYVHEHWKELGLLEKPRTVHCMLLSRGSDKRPEHARSIFFLFLNEEKKPRLVAKSMKSPTTHAMFSEEYNILRTLSRSEFSSYIPTPYAFPTILGHSVFFESYVAGVPASRILEFSTPGSGATPALLERTIEDILRHAEKMLLALRAQTPRNHTKQEFVSIMNSYQRLLPTDGPFLAYFREIEKRITKKDISFVLSNGDFVPTNLICGDTSASLVDWEFSHETPLQFLDAFRFLYYLFHFLVERKAFSVLNFLDAISLLQSDWERKDAHWFTKCARSFLARHSGPWTTMNFSQLLFLFALYERNLFNTVLAYPAQYDEFFHTLLTLCCTESKRTQRLTIATDTFFPEAPLDAIAETAKTIYDRVLPHIEEQQKLLVLKDNHIANIEAALQNQTRALTDAHTLLEHKDVHIRNIESDAMVQRELFTKNIAQLEQAIYTLEQEKEQKIVDLSAQFEQTIAQLSAQSEQKTHALEREKEAIAVTLADLHSKHIGLREQRDTLSHQHASLLEDVSLKQVHIRNIESLLAQERETLQTIYHSRSWRLIHSYATLKKFWLAALWTLRHEGALAVFRKALRIVLGKRGQDTLHTNYQRWIHRHTPTGHDKKALFHAMQQWKECPSFSILVAVREPNIDFLFQTITSLQQQWYPSWELCLGVAQSLPKKMRQTLAKLPQHDVRLHVQFAEHPEDSLFETARHVSKGDLILPLESGDLLAPDALAECARALQHKRPDVIYADEDILEEHGKRRDPYFKPDWSPDLLLSTMYMGHTFYTRSLVEAVGGFRKEFPGNEEYDLALRATEAATKGTIVHIPKLLFHVRPRQTPPPHMTQQVIADALARRRIEAHPLPGLTPTSFRVHRSIKGSPLVSIIIPTKDKAQVLRTCVEGIAAKTHYQQYELVIINNNSEEPTTFDYFADIQKRLPRCRVIDYSKPFNFSAINNFAVTHAHGDLLLFLNNDTEPITEEWLSAMVEQAQRKEVGAVGAKLIYPNNTIQHAGVVLGIGGVAGHAHKYLPHLADEHGYRGLLNVIRNYSAVTAACLMTRRDVFTQVHGFDETLAVAFNDVDLCLRIRKAGYHVVYTPYAVLYHYESISRGKALNQKEVAMMQERWGDLLQNDPFYNPHLSRTHEDFRLAV